MKKIVAVAALMAAAFVVPTVPVQAGSSYPSHCLILPLLKADCRAAISERVNDVADSTRTVASATVSAAEEAADEVSVRLPWWHQCTRAPAGSGHLIDCE